MRVEVTEEVRKKTARLPITFTRRKKWVVASCPILDVHSQGENESKAKKNLANALSLFFVSCFERGTLDAVLKECGFKAIRHHLASLLNESGKISMKQIQGVLRYKRQSTTKKYVHLVFF